MSLLVLICSAVMITLAIALVGIVFASIHDVNQGTGEKLVAVFFLFVAACLFVVAQVLALSEVMKLPTG